MASYFLSFRYYGEEDASQNIALRPQFTIDDFAADVKKELAKESPRQQAKLLLKGFSSISIMHLKKSFRNVADEMVKIINDQNLSSEILKLYRLESLPKELQIMHEAVLRNRDGDFVLIDLLKNIEELGLVQVVDIKSANHGNQTPIEILLNADTYAGTIISAAKYLCKFSQDQENISRCLEIIKTRPELESLNESFQNHLKIIVEQQKKSTLEQAICFHDRLKLEGALLEELSEKTVLQKADLLVNALSAVLAKDIELYMLQTVLKFIAKENLGKEIFEILSAPDCPKELSVLHLLTDIETAFSRSNFLKLKAILEVPHLQSLVDVKSDSYEGETPISKLLKLKANKENVQNILEYLWALIPCAKDSKVIEEAVDLAKMQRAVYVDAFALEDIEYSKLLPEDLLALRLAASAFEKEYGKKPKIIIPAFQSPDNWEILPKQVLIDFGLNAETLVIRKDYFSDAKKIEELREIIQRAVCQSNGLVIVGSAYNLPDELFSEGETVDLTAANTSADSMLTFINAVAFETAIRQGLPILGICFGAQLGMALVGGKVKKLEKPEDSRFSYAKVQIKPRSVLDLRGDIDEPIEVPAFSSHSMGVDLTSVSKRMHPVEFEKDDPTLPNTFEMLDKRGAVIAKAKIIATSAEDKKIPKGYEVRMPEWTSYNSVEDSLLFTGVQIHPERNPREQKFFLFFQNFTDKVASNCAQRCGEELLDDPLPSSQAVVRAGVANVVGELIDDKFR